LSNYEIGNTTYIKNPHYFKPNNTNYYWFVTLKHLHNESFAKFTYEYISEKDSEIEKQPDENKSFLKSIAFWIILMAVLFIIIVVVIIFLIRKNNRQKSLSKIDTLVNDVPQQELMQKNKWVILNDKKHFLKLFFFQY